MFLKDLLHGKEALNRAWQENGGFVEYTDEELRNKQLEILEIYKDVLDVCKEEQLYLLLCGGSALGAVRHKGFIPWDDDIDVTMPRAHFEEFKKIFEKKLGDKYILNCPNYSKKPMTRFAKIFKRSENEGNNKEIFLDVFVLDNTPNFLFLQKIKGVFCNIIMFIAACVSQYKNDNDEIPEIMKEMKTYKTKTAIGFIFSFLSSSWWFNFLDKIIRTANETNFCAITTGRKHYNGELLEKKLVLPPSKIIFEGIPAYTFNDVDAYLKKMYGINYMVPPPKEKREKHYVKAKKNKEKSDIYEI